jgi:tetratricopeptide (TPR) repeat protein
MSGKEPRGGRFANLDEGRWRVLEGMLEHAMDLGPEDCRTFLDAACGPDRTLRDDLEALLAADRAAGSFLERPAAELAPELLDEPGPAPEPLNGRRVGAWRLLREIGRGGMGTVYLAERSDGAFTQQAALKMMRRGLDTDDIVARFRGERQILARLEHPNIARLLDGGATDDGTLYFVMEHVEGERLTDQVVRLQLGLDDALTRFLQVCEAVQHAHRSLVVHRDLKPANILVTPEGRVKLLDFGVARLIAPDASDAGVTLAAERRLTPDYAAPEQIRGEPTTTATDVYGLGAVLYELLSGERPHRRTSSSLAALERAVMEEDPALPSDVLRRDPGAGTAASRAGWAARVRGDLDRIVLKALHQDPAGRYATVDALRADVERFLAGEPVRATAPTLRYRAAKFLGRHRAGVAVAAVLVASVLAGLGVALWQGRIAARERDRAVIEARKASVVRDFLAGLFRAGSPYLAGSIDTTLSALDLVSRGAARARAELAGAPEAQAELMDLLGGIQRDAGRFESADSLVREASRIRLARYGPDHMEYARSLNSLGLLHWARGENAAAESLLQRSLDLRRAHEGPRSGAVLEGLTSLAVAQADNEPARAESSYREAIALAEALYPADDPEVAIQLNNYGALLQSTGRSREARVPLARALEIRAQALGPLHINTAITAELLAQSVMALGEAARADSLYARALVARRRWLEPGHPDLARTIDAMAILARDQGHFTRAESLHLEALAIRRAAFAADHPQVQISLNNLAVAYYFMLRLEPAARAFEEVHAIWSRTIGPDHANTLTARNNLGAVRREQGRYEEAQRILDEVYARRLALTGPDSPATGFSHHNLAQLAFLRGRREEAERHVRRALAIREHHLGAAAQASIASREFLATVLRESGRPSEAMKEYRTALAACRSTFDQPHPVTADVLVGLGRLLLNQDRATEARPLLEEALSIRRRRYEPGDVRTGETLVALGDCLVRLGEAEAARPLLEQGLAAMRRRPGRPDPLIARGAAELGRLAVGERRGG